MGSDIERSSVSEDQTALNIRERAGRRKRKPVTSPESCSRRIRDLDVQHGLVAPGGDPGVGAPLVRDSPAPVGLGSHAPAPRDTIGTQYPEPARAQTGRQKP